MTNTDPLLDPSQQGIFIVSHHLIIAITRFHMLDRDYSLLFVHGVRTCHSPSAGLLHYAMMNHHCHSASEQTPNGLSNDRAREL